MLASVIRSSVIFIGITVAAVVMLSDNSTLFSPTGVGSRIPAAVAERTQGAESQPQEHATESREQPVERGEMVVQAGPHGHFFVDALIGRNEIGFVVDTGASMVALSPAHAEQLGYNLQQLDFAGRAETANGTARFAPVILDEIVIGDIVVRNVQAAVMDTPMEKSLLGMTFLRRLAGFEVKGDRLILRW